MASSNTNVEAGDDQLVGTSAGFDDEAKKKSRVTAVRKECPEIAEIKYEYLDHTADVQIHSWGDSLAETYEQASIAMFGYMTEIDTVDVEYTFDILAEGHDLESLLFHYLDEWLYAFSAEPFFIARVIKIMECDKENFRIRARGWGESFDLKKHPQGTEVKAITYSNMQVYDEDNNHTLYVIIDI